MFTEAIKLIIGKITISFFFIFSDKKHRCKAAVPLEQVKAYLEPTLLEKIFSKLSTSLPVVISSFLSVFLTVFMSVIIY